MDSHHEDANVLIKRRHEELEELKKNDFVPYAYEHKVTAHSQSIKDDFENLFEKDVRIMGTISGTEPKINQNIRLIKADIQNGDYHFELKLLES